MDLANQQFSWNFYARKAAYLRFLRAFALPSALRPYYWRSGIIVFVLAATIDSGFSCLPVPVGLVKYRKMSLVVGNFFISDTDNDCNHYRYYRKYRCFYRRFEDARTNHSNVLFLPAGRLE